MSLSERLFNEGKAQMGRVAFFSALVKQLEYCHVTMVQGASDSTYCKFVRLPAQLAFLRDDG